MTQRLREPRVRRIIEPRLAGRTLGDVPEDDLLFVQELGLVRIASTGGIEAFLAFWRQHGQPLLAIAHYLPRGAGQNGSPAPVGMPCRAVAMCCP